MAAGITPIFVATPMEWHGRITAANTNRDGTGTLVTLATGAANGSRIDRINIVAIVTTTAGMIRFFLDDATNVRAWKEIAVTAITPSASVAAFSNEIVRTDTQPLIILPPNWILKVGTHNAESFDVHASGGNY